MFQNVFTIQRHEHTCDAALARTATNRAPIVVEAKVLFTLLYHLPPRYTTQHVSEFTQWVRSDEMFCATKLQVMLWDLGATRYCSNALTFCALLKKRCVVPYWLCETHTFDRKTELERQQVIVCWKSERHIQSVQEQNSIESKSSYVRKQGGNRQGPTYPWQCVLIMHIAAK